MIRRISELETFAEERDKAALECKEELRRWKDYAQPVVGSRLLDPPLDESRPVWGASPLKLKEDARKRASSTGPPSLAGRLTLLAGGAEEEKGSGGSFGPYGGHVRSDDKKAAGKRMGDSALLGALSTGADVGGRKTRDSTTGKAGDDSDGDSRSSARSRTRKPVSAVLAQSSKVIRTRLQRTDDITTFLDNCKRIESAINADYGEESQKTKIRIALNAFSDELRGDGDHVYEEMERDGDFNLNQFFQIVFKMSFPAPSSMLISGFESLTQNHPTKSSLVDYARKFRTLIRLLQYDVEGFKGKWVSGLSNAELKSALRRTNWEQISFAELVALAIAINTNLEKEKPSAKVFSARDEEGLEGKGEEESVLKIFDVPTSRYFRMADKHGVGGKCYNCFGNHRSNECRVKTCKFCHAPNKDARHFSLICPKAPSDFSKFLDTRAKAKLDKGLRYASDFDAYQFSDGEISD